MSDLAAGRPGPPSLTDQEIIDQIDVIDENLQVCGSRSSYALRNRPYLRLLIIEAERRGLDIDI